MKLLDEFDTKNRQKQSFTTYYEAQYNKMGIDVEQAFIIHWQGIGDKQGITSGPIYLIPGLCNMFRLSDKQREIWGGRKAVLNNKWKLPYIDFDENVAKD